MTPGERAAAIGIAMGSKTVTYTFRGITFRVGAASVAGGTVTVTIAAWTGAGANRVNLPLGDGVFNFVNPPLMAPDGGTEIVTPPKGLPYTRPTFTRNDLAAAQLMVYNDVTACARRLGWTP